MTDDLEKTTIVPQEAYESTVDSAPAAAVNPPRPVGTGGRFRWAIASGVVVLVVLATVLAITLFSGRAANAVVLGYVPGDSIMYGEVRMDLPGDQRAAVGGFLSKFPGFADQSAIETKVDEVLDRLVGSASDGGQAFSTDIKPWFGGQVAFSVGGLPDPATLSPDSVVMPDFRGLVLVSVNNEAVAKAWFDSLIAEGGVATTTETYNGASLTVATHDGTQQGAYALLGGKVAVIGDLASVKAAVDTKGAGSFAATPDLTTALDATSGDHVGFVYVAVRPLLDWSNRMGASAAPGLVPGGVMAGLVPDWAAFALRVEGDALRMETLSPKPEGEAGAARTSIVADHVPATAIALSVSNDYGKGILATIDQYRAEPSLKEAIDGFDQAIGVLGGADAAIGWIGDFGVAVTKTTDGVEGGLVIAPTDKAAAESMFTSLRTLASLGGTAAGITVREETHAGTTITIVDLGSLKDLAGLAGAAAGASPEMFGTALPAGRIELAYAITDQVVVLGSGPGFVRSVLDTTPATSLGQTERYKSLVSRAGGGSGSGFADVTAIREMLEGAMANADAGERAEYEANIKPFLTPFDALVASTSIQGDISRSTVIVTVK